MLSCLGSMQYGAIGEMSDQARRAALLPLGPNIWQFIALTFLALQYHVTVFFPFCDESSRAERVDMVLYSRLANGRVIFLLEHLDSLLETGCISIDHIQLVPLRISTK